MTTYLRIRRDGIPLHNHPTNRNPNGHWHGAWEQHHDMRDAHDVHNAAEPIFETSGRNSGHMSIEQAIRWGHMSQAQWEMYTRSLNGEVLIHWYQRKQERRANRLNGTVAVASPALPDDWMIPLSERKFGVEIECCTNLSALITACRNKGITLSDQMATYSHEAPSTWKAMGDGSVRYSGSVPSIRPVEIVSPILQGADGLRQLKLMTEAMAEVGTVVNQTCGLHVHHDAHDMTVANALRVAMNFNNAQAAIDKLVAPSRRGQRQYCGPFLPHEVTRMQTATAIMDFPGDRYRNINIAPAWRAHRTFEIRQHQGSIEFKKIAAWIKLGQRIMDSGRAGVMVETGTVDLSVFFNKINVPMHLRTFFRERAKYFKMITDAEGERILNGAEPTPAPVFTPEEEAPQALPDIPSVFTRDERGRIIPTPAGMANGPVGLRPVVVLD